MNKQKSINLALQGGGSHGAFTWGVISRLLEVETLEIKAISGVSSGAMNAVVLASALTRGDVGEAKKKLESFWQSVSAKYSEIFELSPVHIWDKVAGFDHMDSFDTYLSMTQAFSPYQLNPFNLNPLKDILIDHVDFDLLQKECPVRLHIGATQVRTGKMKVFTNHEITADAVLASACLPSLHHAIEIDGEPYWDGGYSGNPPLFPLIFNSDVSDILVVLLQPLLRDSLPKTVDEIKKRAHELSFTNTFLREMRAIAISKQELKDDFISSGRLDRRLNQLKLHMIEDKTFEALDNNSRYKVEAGFIEELYERGFNMTEQWLSRHYNSIGKKSSIDLLKLFV